MLLWCWSVLEMCCTTAKPSTESHMEQPTGLPVKWLPRNSGEQRVLYCWTIGSCLVCRGPPFDQTAPRWQWKACVFAYMGRVLRTDLKLCLRWPLESHMDILYFILLHNAGSDLAAVWGHVLPYSCSPTYFDSVFVSCLYLGLNKGAVFWQACFHPVA